MARPLRIEVEGGLYHVTSRGDRREAIYEDHEDRQKFLTILGDVIGQMRWFCYGYCLMDNHYHLLIETPDCNLAKGMRQLNGIYTQASNRRHGRCGHLFQGRYKSIMVDAEAHLLELSRYVVLNPVRAGMAADPSDWPWSSYSGTAGKAKAPDWLAADRLLAHFAKQPAAARRRYAAFVLDGIGRKSIWQGLNRQVFLGDDDFVTRMQASMATRGRDVNIPQLQQRSPPPTLAQIAAKYGFRDEAMVAAHATGEYSYARIAEHFGVHFTTVGRIVRKARIVR
ncbi:MAG: transposase [Mariprofundaceae bacterium]